MPVNAAEETLIQAAVRDAEQEFAPLVRYIRYDVAEDWTGKPSVFFRVVLSDEGRKMPLLHELAATLRWRVTEKLDLPSHDLFPFFEFRSESEQASVNHPEWAPR